MGWLLKKTHFNRRFILPPTSLLKSYEISHLMNWNYKIFIILIKEEMKITAGWLFTPPTCCWLLPRAKEILRNFYCMHCARSGMEDYARTWKVMQHYVRWCKLRGEGGVVYEIIVLPLGYSINLLTFGSYVEMVRLFVKMTVLLMISLKLEHTVSTWGLGWI